MSIQESSERKASFSGVDPIVPESLDSALGQLHLEELEETPASESGIRPSNEANAQFSSVPPSHMFPHPQMFGMGFIPYSQMMPVPHHTGFFPSPDSGIGMTGLANNSPGGPIMFNNSNDASVFSPPPGPTSEGFRVSALTGETTAPKANDPLWASGSASQAAVDTLASSATKDAAFMNNSSSSKVAAVSSTGFRRQTFHAISANDLVDSMVSKSSAADSVINSDSTDKPSAANLLQPEQLDVPAVRAQSISLEKNNNNSIFTAPEPTEDQEGSKTAAGEEANSSVSYAAAYPYGGALMQPNPVLSGHPLPGSSPAYGVASPFHGAYGFASPFQFSGVHSPSSHLQPNSPFPVAQVGEGSAGNRQVPSPAHGEHPGNTVLEEPSSAAQVPSLHQHQQNGTPPPWIYGNHPFGIVPHPFSQGHHHMLHPNGGHTGDHTNHSNRRSNNGGHKGGKSGHYSNGRNKNRNGGHYHQNNSNHGGDNANRQRKMEEAARYADASLEQFIGSIYSLCKDQHGCRFLQKQLDVLGSEAADSIFKETKDHTVELMTDSFGNYLIQKLLERVTLEQRVSLAKMAAPHFVYIASNPHGTRALQKLVECIQTKQEAQIVIDSLKGSVVELSKDLNGNHIVQKCLQKLKPSDVQFIFDAACSHCTEIATHRHGCCVLQRCLDHGDEEQRTKLCGKLLTNIDHLTLDPFGNYVVQYIISKETEQGDYKFTYQIVHALKPKVTELSLHKFGSNVIEKILRTPEVSDILVVELLGARGETDIQALLNDGYGNYVLQTMLDVTHQYNQYLHRSLVDIVRPLLVGPIRNTPHGRRIMGILRID
ncbi:hypothetical protein HG536_0D04400 [Torulaspora globosa]|uniref:PUM-HD domain-containing protein n=1 Tax=Torulaspora globosa TaxID=48254 RepID=A0A7G3ZHD2_9SACH|nr:uncharacterized protein HG536_0D04400 [Torulaspora globosa]QLL32918.1 hypothetical protein HG536_0D04400 [Torulaspora globosa]